MSKHKRLLIRFTEEEGLYLKWKAREKFRSVTAFIRFILSQYRDKEDSSRINPPSVN